MSELANWTIWSRNALSVITSIEAARAAAETANMATKIAVMRKPSVCSSLIRTEDIACAPDGVDQFRSMAPGQLGPEAADMGLNNIGAWIEIQLPHMFQQHGAGDGASGIADQIFQQPEFLGLQLNRL